MTATLRMLSLAFAVVAFVGGCATYASKGNAPIADTGTWANGVQTSTRRAESYDWTHREADLRCTLLTPAMKKAFAQERARFHGRPAHDLETDLVQMGNPDPGVDVVAPSAPAAEAEVLAFCAMYVTDTKNRDISAHYTIWDTTLSRGAVVQKPVRIEPLKLTPGLVDMFPYVDRFDDVYLLRFPLIATDGTSMLAPGAPPLVLSVKSALADLQLEWSLQAP